MPELDDIVQRISLSGSDEVVFAFGEIGKAGVKAFEDISSHAGVIGEGLAAGVAAIAGLGGALLLASKHATETVIELRNLANVSGESLAGISSLQAGLAAMGADTDRLGSSFRRMGIVIEGAWDEIKKDSAEAKDKQISDILAVQKAHQSAFDEREKARKKLDELGVPTSNLGYVSDYQIRQNEIAKVRTSLAESELKVREAQRKADQDRLNSLDAISTAVEKVIKGEASIADVSQEANLSTENIIKGITAASTPGATDAIHNLTGDLQQLTGLLPNIKEALYNVADFLHNAKDAATETALEVRIFGRNISQDMIVPLKEGSAAIKASEERMKSFGLVITDQALKPAEEFHKQFNELGYALSTTIAQTGLKLDPAFTEGLKTFTDFIEQNHDTIMKWGDDLANVVGPIVKSFAESLTGLLAALAGIETDPNTGVGQWAKSWKEALDPLKEALKEIVGLFHELDHAAEWLRTGGGLGAQLNEWLRSKGVPLPTPPPPEKEEAKKAEEAKPSKPGEAAEAKGIGTAGLREATEHAGAATTELASAVKGNTTSQERLTSALDKHSGAQAKHTEGWVKASDNLADKLKPGKTFESKLPGGPKFVTPEEAVPPKFVTPPKEVTAPSPKEAAQPSPKPPELQPAPTPPPPPQPPAPKPTPLGAQPPSMVIKPSYPETRVGAAAGEPPPVITFKTPEPPKAPAAPTPPTAPPTAPPAPAAAPSTTALDSAVNAADIVNKAINPLSLLPNILINGIKEILHESTGTGIGGARNVITPQSEIGRPEAPPSTTRPQEGTGLLGPASEQTTSDVNLLNEATSAFTAKLTEAGSKIGQLFAAKPASTPGGEVGGEIGPQGEQTAAAIKATGDAAQGLVSKLNDAVSALGNFVSSLQTASSQTSSGGGGGGGASETPASVATAGTEGFATGGLVGGSEGHDTNIIRATKGEYVVRKDGSNLGDAIAHFTKGFAEGGLVGGFVETMRIPGYATGGMVVRTAAAGGASSGGRPIELHIGGEKVSGLTANESAANQISRIAVERAVRSGYSGGKSSWYRGS